MLSDRIKRLRAFVLEHDAPCDFKFGSPLVLQPGELLAGGRVLDPVEEAARRERAKNPPKRTPKAWPKNIAEAFERRFIRSCGNHQCPDFAYLLDNGMVDVLRRIAESEAAHEGDAKALGFLKSMREQAEGMISYCRRCAEALRVEMSSCSDPARKAELAEMASNCDRVIEKPATSFWEACQAAWFVFLLCPDSPGRMDQYLWKFYKNDIDEGRIDKEFAKELLCCLWIKIFGFAGRQHQRGGINHMSLGGTTPDGRDAVNELSWLCLDVAEEMQLIRPQIALRWSSSTPKAFLRRGVEVLRANFGSPDFTNDESVVPALVRIGVKLEDARNFTPSGCNEIMIPGKSQMGALMGQFNLPATLLWVLGVEPSPSGKAFPKAHDWESFWLSWREALAELVEIVHQVSWELDEERSKQNWWPGFSLLTDFCIERALGLSAGGALYNYCNWDAIGVANLTDAMVSIKKLVFDKKELSLDEVVSILKSDWRGSESLRLRLLNSKELYGNGDAETDAVAAEIIRETDSQLQRFKPFRGGRYTLGTLAGYENAHVDFGTRSGATFDGRRAGEPFSSSVGPAPGRDKRGLTAMLNSVASLPHKLLPTSTTLNVTIDPKSIETAAGAERFASAIEAHFKAGGQELQVTVADAELLRKAQLEPELHSSVMVRVAGYSAKFLSLDKETQDEIISRTVNN